MYDSAEPASSHRPFYKFQLLFYRSHCILLTCFLLFYFQPSQAQQDPEFPQGGIFYVQLSQGVVTAFDHSPDNYLIGLGINPQYTLVPGLLRLGLRADGIYTQKKWHGIAGPAIALKLGNIRADPLGTLANYQLLLHYLWGTRNQHLPGGGFRAEIGQLFNLSITANRDYTHDQWWFQTALGINLFPKKNKNEDPFSRNP